MLVLGFPAQAFGTNCYLVAQAAGEECLVIDPGIGVLDRLADLLRQYRLRPAAVLVTHGHLDHVFSVTPVCGAYGVAVSVHSQDRYRLVDPVSTLGPQLKQLFEQQFGTQGWKEPDAIVALEDGQRLNIASIDVEVIHAPGHTEGSVMFALPGVPDDLAADAGLGSTGLGSTGLGSTVLGSTVLSGDVLFAGSIGRTDLPGGSSAAMTRSLRDRVLPMDDATLVLPGHGGVTTIGQERAANPYLQPAFLID
jgi:glyoxylase-like metal-dependent hydrolase (beta-lactamase superfamily II)